MTILSLLFAIVLLCIGVWVAKSIPVPFSYVVYAVIVLAICVLLLELTGIMGAGVLNRRI
jgi:hypothetical protein